jgi:molybdenum cofactor sulfurtransferase
MQGRKPLTQKILPMLCTIHPILDIDQKIMRLSCPGFPEFVFNLKTSEHGNTIKETHCVGKVCGDTVEGFDCGIEVAEWLELVTGLSDLKLVKLIKRIQRKTMKRFVDEMPAQLKSFANEGQFLILNLDSAKELEKHLPAISLKTNISEKKEMSSRVDWIIEQFRGNIVISGVKAFDEEKWKCVRIKDNQERWLTLEVEGMCNRCNVISVDQSNGEIVEEPLKTLTKMEGRKFKFGVLASLIQETENNLNDTLSQITSVCDIEIIYK